MSRFSGNAGSRPRTRVDTRGPDRHSAVVTTAASRGDLGDEIRRRRKERHLTQPELAKLAAVATTNVGKIERGEPVSATTVRAIARALDLPAELTAPFLSDRPSNRPPSTGLSDDERVLIHKLRRRGWPAGDIAEVLDELRRSSADQPAVEQRKETDQGRNVKSAPQMGETGTE